MLYEGFESTRGSIEHPMLKLGRVEELRSVSLTIFKFANLVAFVIKRSNQMANLIRQPMSVCTLSCDGDCLILLSQIEDLYMCMCWV